MPSPTFSLPVLVALSAAAVPAVAWENALSLQLCNHSELALECLLTHFGAGAMGRVGWSGSDAKEVQALRPSGPGRSTNATTTLNADPGATRRIHLDPLGALAGVEAHFLVQDPSRQPVATFVLRLDGNKGTLACEELELSAAWDGKFAEGTLTLRPGLDLIMDGKSQDGASFPGGSSAGDSKQAGSAPAAPRSHGVKRRRDGAAPGGSPSAPSAPDRESAGAPVRESGLAEPSPLKRPRPAADASSSSSSSSSSADPKAGDLTEEEEAFLAGGGEAETVWANNGKRGGGYPIEVLVRATGKIWPFASVHAMHMPDFGKDVAYKRLKHGYRTGDLCLIRYARLARRGRASAHPAGGGAPGAAAPVDAAQDPMVLTLRNRASRDVQVILARYAAGAEGRTGVVGPDRRTLTWLQPSAQPQNSADPTQFTMAAGGSRHVALANPGQLATVEAHFAVLDRGVDSESREIATFAVRHEAAKGTWTCAGLRTGNGWTGRMEQGILVLDVAADREGGPGARAQSAPAAADPGPQAMDLAQEPPLAGGGMGSGLSALAEAVAMTADRGRT
jgi:hypothetical protein